MNKLNKIRESTIQQDIVNGIRLFYSNELFVFAVPNGGKRNVREAVTLKRTGTFAGVSDLVVVGYKRVFFVEVKTSKGVMSDNQSNFKSIVEGKGFNYLIVRSFADFKKKYENIVCGKNNVEQSNIINL